MQFSFYLFLFVIILFQILNPLDKLLIYLLTFLKSWESCMEFLSLEELRLITWQGREDNNLVTVVSAGFLHCKVIRLSERQRNKEKERVIETSSDCWFTP